jgi:glycosyltransferase involved in cell wall biosynthesis
MMQGQSIICFANDWDSDPTSKHHVMKILSRANKILWINSIGMRTPTLSRSDGRRIWAKLRESTKGLCKVNNNLYHFTPLVLPFPSSQAATSINKYLLKAVISYYKKKLNMKDVQLWTFLPNVVDLLGSLGEELVIYYCVDEWSKFSFMDGRSMKKMEIKLLKKADLVITSAKNLFRDKVRYNADTHLVTHGVDYDYFSKVLFDSIPIAEDIKTIKRPIIGFFGLIHEWIDLELLEKIAITNPEWSLVLIGKASVDIERLTKHENVHHLGQKPYDKLINYCKAFDVALIPFRVNDLTANVNPIKLREYLAAGIPVVSTALPEVLKYRDMVKIGHNPEQINEQIDMFLRTDNRERKTLRSQSMKEETWDKKADRISKLISSLINQVD